MDFVPLQTGCDRCIKNVTCYYSAIYNSVLIIITKNAPAKLSAACRLGAVLLPKWRRTVKEVKDGLKLPRLVIDLML